MIIKVLRLECPMCGHTHKIDKNIDAEDWNNWQDGMCIQYAMPYLNATEREQLISGLCPKCQKEVFE